MRKSIKIAALILGTALLASCASSGNQAIKDETSASVAEKVIEGKTSSTQVQALYGAPTSTSFTGGGQEIWTYVFEDTTADAVSFIPIVGAFGGSSSGTRTQITILFDDHDIVKKVKLSKADVSHKTGVFSN